MLLLRHSAAVIVVQNSFYFLPPSFLPIADSNILQKPLHVRKVTVKLAMMTAYSNEFSAAAFLALTLPNFSLGFIIFPYYS